MMNAMTNGVTLADIARMANMANIQQQPRQIGMPQMPTLRLPATDPAFFAGMKAPRTEPANLDPKEKKEKPDEGSTARKWLFDPLDIMDNETERMLFDPLDVLGGFKNKFDPLGIF